MAALVEGNREEGDASTIECPVSSSFGVSVLKGHKGCVNILDTSHFDINLVASGSDDKAIRIWDIRIEKTVKSILGSSAPITTLAFDPRSENALYCIMNGEIGYAITYPSTSTLYHSLRMFYFLSSSLPSSLLPYLCNVIDLYLFR